MIPVFALQDLEFKSISASNDQVSVDIQFGELEIMRKPRQTLESVIIGYGQTEFSLLNPQLTTFVRSFSIKSFEDGILISGTKVADTYDLQLFVFTAKGVYKQDLSGIIKDSKETGLTTPDTEIVKKDLTDLKVLTKQDLRTSWAHSYDIFVKVFDGKLNQNPIFDSFDGTRPQAEIKATLTHESETKPLTVLEGITDSNGYWHGQYFIADNTFPGRYFVNITTTYQGAKNTQTLEMFVIGDARSTDPSP